MKEAAMSDKVRFLLAGDTFPVEKNTKLFARETLMHCLANVYASCLLLTITACATLKVVLPIPTSLPRR